MSSNPSRDVFLGLILGLTGVLLFSGTLPASPLAMASFDPGLPTFERAHLAGIAAIMLREAVIWEAFVFALAVLAVEAAGRMAQVKR